MAQANTWSVIYLDRRATEEEVYTRQSRPKKAQKTTRTMNAHLYNIMGSADEVNDNINQLLETFEQGEQILCSTIFVLLKLTSVFV